MARTLTAVVTALWLAPLLGWRIGVLLASSVQPSSSPQITAAERGMGEGLLLLGGGILAGIAIFVATIALVYAYVPTRSLRSLQMTDGVAIACLLVWGLVAYASVRQQDAPVYDGFRAALDVEVRAPKALAESSRGFYASIPGGTSRDQAFTDLTREDNGYSIVPIEVTVYSVHDWKVRVGRSTQQNNVANYTFQLNLRDFPKANLPWSDWIEPAPVPGLDWVQADGVTIRYRWVLTPADQKRVYQP